LRRTIASRDTYGERKYGEQNHDRTTNPALSLVEIVEIDQPQQLSFTTHLSFYHTKLRARKQGTARDHSNFNHPISLDNHAFRLVASHCPAST
jgi:hypothetical protein